LHNWIVGPAFLVTFLPVYLRRVPHEEQMMLNNFGPEYREYMDRTGRIIPRAGRS
jgi:protein-S-isoprenylcysteine O-methyltransferase Ste14